LPHLYSRATYKFIFLFAYLTYFPVANLTIKTRTAKTAADLHAPTAIFFTVLAVAQIILYPA